MEFRDYLAWYRHETGMTLLEISEKSGVPKTTLDKIISGSTRSPTLETAVRIAVALGKTADDFVDYDCESIKKIKNKDAGNKNIEKIKIKNPDPANGAGDEDFNRQFRELWDRLPPSGRQAILTLLELTVRQTPAGRVSDRP